MSPQNDPSQNNEEPTLQALSDTQGDENPQTHTEVPNRDESDETMTTFKPPQIDMELAARTIAQTARAAQRVRDAEAELVAAREAEVAIHAIRRGSLDPDEALKMALDLIGRRSDVVAVQLPEPDNGFWYINEHGGNVHLGPVAGQMLVDAGAILWGINTDEARTLAAALLAAANVADAAEGGAQ